MLHMVQPPESSLARLRRVHQLIIDLAETTPDVLRNPEAARGLQQHLIGAAFAAIPDSGGETVRHHYRQRVMARFEALIEAKPDQSLYLAEVCDAIGATERTFRAACQQTLGMSPTRYLWLRRMHLARWTLMLADPANRTVTEIATSHGFWELGRFSVAYRALFGESPSRTLNRPADNQLARRPDPLLWADSESA
jgi:AraC-like DNA-binding protein